MLLIIGIVGVFCFFFGNNIFVLVHLVTPSLLVYAILQDWLAPPVPY